MKKILELATKKKSQSGKRGHADSESQNFIISKPVKLEQQDKTSIIKACKENVAQKIKYLIELDQNLDIEFRNRKGYTPLMIAAQHGSEKVIELLIKAGINVNAVNNKDQDMTALHYASYNAQPRAVKELLKVNGIKVDTVNKKGRTALFCAVEHYKYDDKKQDNYQIMELLLKQGAEITQADDHNHTIPYIIFWKKQDPELITLFASYYHDRDELQDQLQNIHLPKIQEAFKKGVNINHTKNTIRNIILNSKDQNQAFKIIEQIIKNKGIITIAIAKAMIDNAKHWDTIQVAIQNIMFFDSENQKLTFDIIINTIEDSQRHPQDFKGFKTLDELIKKFQIYHKSCEEGVKEELAALSLTDKKLSQNAQDKILAIFNKQSIFLDPHVKKHVQELEEQWQNNLEYKNSPPTSIRPDDVPSFKNESQIQQK